MTGRTDLGETRRVGLGAALLVAIAVTAYLPILGCGWVWDDDFYVTDNPTLRDGAGLVRIWTDPSANPQYYPMTFTSLWLQHRFWGLLPLPYHLANVLLHAVSAVLLWRLLLYLSVPGAWLAAAVFALHPVHVETVAWVTERKNTLSGAFYLASALVLLRRFGVGGGREAPGGDSRVPWLGGLLYLAALLSKTVTASLPVALALVLWWKRGRVARRQGIVLGIMLGLGAALGTTTALLERHQIGAVGEDWSLGVIERVLLAGRIVWFYLGKLAWPSGLTFIYPRWEIRAEDAANWAWPVAAAATTAALWFLRGRWGKAPFVAWAFFVVTLAPALGFVNVYPMRYAWVADHFQYLASLGPIVLAAAGVLHGAAFVSARWGTVGRHAAAGAATVLLLALSALTWRGTLRFRDAETLWNDTLARNPTAWIAHNNLGIALASRGDDEAAASHFREALRLRPRHAGALSNLGYLLLRQGRTGEAEAYLAESVSLGPADVNARLHLAEAFVRQGRPEAAEPHLRAAVGLRPDDADLRYNLGTLLAESGRYTDAVVQLEAALRLRPGFAEARRNLDLARTLAAPRPAGASAPLPSPVPGG